MRLRVLQHSIIYILIITLLLSCSTKQQNDEYAVFTCPSQNFVVSCLNKIADIDKVESVSIDNDPNGLLYKPKGYMSATYFTLFNITNDTSKTPIIAGTDGGGCIEVYPTFELAEERSQYLSTFDTGWCITSGYHKKIGSTIIRISDKLTEEQYTQLEEKIINMFITEQKYFNK